MFIYIILIFTDGIRKLSSFKAKVINNENKPKLEKFLSYLAQRNKAAKLKCGHFPSGTCAFLIPQVINQNDGTLTFHQFAPNYIPPSIPKTSNDFNQQQQQSIVNRKRGLEEVETNNHMIHDSNRPPSPTGYPPQRPTSPLGLPVGSSLSMTSGHLEKSNKQYNISESSIVHVPKTPEYPPPGWIPGWIPGTTVTSNIINTNQQGMKKQFKPFSPNYPPPGWMGETLPLKQEQEEALVFNNNNISSFSSSNIKIDDDWGGDQQIAANKYSLLERTKASMVSSRIFHMRKLNNLIKKTLIDDAMKQFKKQSQGIHHLFLSAFFFCVCFIVIFSFL